MEVIKKEKYVSHPMEDVLDLTPCTTVQEYVEVVPAVPVIPVTYDEKDTEINSKLEEIYATAMGTAMDLNDAVETVEGKYKARIGEVSAAMLGVALGAVREQRGTKEHKDKTLKLGPSTVNNNLNILTDRNEILELLRKQNNAS